MEFTYREDTFPQMKRRMLFRGFSLFILSTVCALTYWHSTPWYLSILPASVLILFSLSDLFSIKRVEKYRKAIKVILDNMGITICAYGTRPLTFKWDAISITKENSSNGTLKSFTIKTGDRYLKEFEFTNELCLFSELHREVCNRLRT